MSRVRFDPGLRFGIDLARIAPRGSDRRTDDDADGAGLLRSVRGAASSSRHRAPPARSAARSRDASSAPLTPYLRVSPGGMRVPSGKITIHSPSASRALPCSITLAHRGRAGAAIDRDRAQLADAPADERDPGQLALEHPDLRRQQQRLRHRLPARGMLDQRDVIAGRQLLASLDPIVEPAGPAQHRAGSPAPRPAPAAKRPRNGRNRQAMTKKIA